MFARFKRRTGPSVLLQSMENVGEAFKGEVKNMKARDLMTGALVTCSTDTPVADVAKLMRDRNIGDVLVADDGKLVGIATDRDIAVRAAAAGDDPLTVPIKHYMSTRVVSGKPDWSVDQMAKTMSKHQIRRLPIIENGLLVGIVSLGDLALKSKKKPKIAESLKAISEPTGVHRLRRGHRRTLSTLGLALLVGAVLALTMSPKTVSNLIERVQDSRLGNDLMDALERGRDKLVAQVSAKL